MNTKEFVRALAKCGREEEVKAAYVAWLGLPVSTEANQDLVTDDVIWEFKYQKDLSDPRQLARVVAQACYYLRRATLEGSGTRALPRAVACADADEAVIIPSSALVPAFALPVDWKGAASSPGQVLVDAMVAIASEAQVYDMRDVRECDGFGHALAAVSGMTAPKREVTLLNFEDAYLHWCAAVGGKLPEAVRGSAFVVDLGADPLNTAYSPEKGKLQLTVNGATHAVSVKKRDYEKFWSIWGRPPDVREFQRILGHTDRLKAMHDRRRFGVFYTPANVARLALDYLEAELGPGWEDRYWVWDPCCGGAELTRFHPRPDRCFLSTIDQSEIDLIQEYNLAEAAEIFQYDYVNDDVDKLAAGDDLLGSGWKMPATLRKILAEAPERLVVLMNPPYAAATDGGSRGASKTGVSMHKAKTAFGNAGKAAQELYTQFLLRSDHHKAGVIAVFSTLKLTNTEGYAKVRDLMPYGLMRGFLVCSKVFHGVKGLFPVGFHVLRRNLGEGYAAVMDVVEQDDDNLLVKTGGKSVGMPERPALNTWVVTKARPTIPAAPLTSALSLQVFRPSVVDTLWEGAFGYMGSNSSDVQNSGQFVLWLSSALGRGHGWSITRDNLRKSAMIFAVRKVIKKTWLNNQDQFTVPPEEPDDTFYGDCLVYTLFHGKNQTSSLKDVEYKGVTYQIRNQFYPYAPERMLDGVRDVAWANQLGRAKPTVIHGELQALEASKALSAEAWQVLNAGRAVYTLFNRHIAELDRDTWKIAYWDAGWYQVRNALAAAGLGTPELAALKAAHAALGDKIRPQVYSLGFLRA